MSDVRTRAWKIDEHGRCPRCGSPTITDGTIIWCTFVGGDFERPCTYGIDEHVPLPAPTSTGAA